MILFGTIFSGNRKVVLLRNLEVCAITAMRRATGKLSAQKNQKTKCAIIAYLQDTGNQSANLIQTTRTPERWFLGFGVFSVLVFQCFGISVFFSVFKCLVFLSQCFSDLVFLVCRFWCCSTVFRCYHTYSTTRLNIFTFFTNLTFSGL